ncbi:MAG: ABC transporter permease [Anaerolineae bacterium]|nr:ABC transporter permease [Anaerolineae bacterium]
MPVIAWLRRDRTALLGLFLVCLWLVMALLGPLMISTDPNRQDLSGALLPPFWQPGGTPNYPLGTDHLGRDILTRIIYGARTSLLIGVTAVGLAGLIGSLAGVVAGEWGGWVDEVIMRLADIQLAIPFILLGITVLALLGASISTMVLVLVLFGWVIYARVVRSDVLQLREQEFVLAARASGARRLRIILRHLLPNVTNQIIIIATLELANVIILEAALSFLGLGIRPPDVSWGAMLANGRDYLTVGWWIATLPGIVITLTILGINLMGDWANDMLDPRRRWRLEL